MRLKSQMSFVRECVFISGQNVNSQLRNIIVVRAQPALIGNVLFSELKVQGDNMHTHHAINVDSMQ